jgi:TetR/AcrR family fatty acid metabolism transcriptional regulator
MTSPTNRNGHLEQRRKEILAAAEKVFAANGYAATTVDQVAAEAGISKGSMYNYFRTKEELFQQSFADVIAETEKESYAALEGPGSSVAALREILAVWARRLEKDKRLGRLFLEFWTTAAREGETGRIGGWFADMYARWRDRIAALIERGQASGEFHVVDPRNAAALLMAVLDGITVQLILDVGLKVDDDFLAALDRAVFNALRGGDGPGRSGGSSETAT